jgi:hypothetical protein
MCLPEADLSGELSIVFKQEESLVDWCNWPVIETSSCEHVQVTVLIHVVPFNFMIEELGMFALHVLASRSHVVHFQTVSIENSDAAVIF